MLDDGSGKYDPYGWLLEPTMVFPHEERVVISRILGREYTKIERVSHRAFNARGTTVRLSSGDLAYTEAWAGSGEFAVVQLVAALGAAPDRALVLVDEPEVSLHPQAQRRLVQFLMNEARAKKLQVVFATHSPTMVEGLPRRAIKVLDVDPDGTVVLREQEALPEQAFATIGHVFPKKTVVVEDALAKAIVEAALRGDEAAGSLLDTVEVRFQAGGASRLLTRYVPHWASDPRDSEILLMLDGDMRPANQRPPSSCIAPSELRTTVAALLNVGVVDVSAHVPANTGGPTEEQLRALLEWADGHVDYLPGEQPERWLAAAVDPDYDPATDAKQWWADRAHSELGLSPEESASSGDILETQRRALAGIQGCNAELKAVRERVVRFLEGAS